MKLINILYYFDLLLLLISDSYQDGIMFDLSEKVHYAEKLYSFRINYPLRVIPDGIITKYVITPHYGRVNTGYGSYNFLGGYIYPFKIHPHYKELSNDVSRLMMAVDVDIEKDITDRYSLIYLYVNHILRSDYNNIISPIIILEDRYVDYEIYNLIFPIEVNEQVYNRYLYICINNIITQTEENYVNYYVAKCDDRDELLKYQSKTVKPKYISTKFHMRKVLREISDSYLNNKPEILYGVGEPIVEDILYPIEHIIPITTNGRTYINNRTVRNSQMLMKHFISIKSISYNIYAMVYGSGYQLDIISRNNTSLSQYANAQHYSCVVHNCKPQTICIFNTTKCIDPLIILRDIETNAWRHHKVVKNHYIMNNPLKYNIIPSHDILTLDAVRVSQNNVFDNIKHNFTKLQTQILKITSINNVLIFLSVITVTIILMFCLITLYQQNRLRQLSNPSYQEVENPLS
jgi:hypothetical protein